MCKIRVLFVELKISTRIFPQVVRTYDEVNIWLYETRKIENLVMGEWHFG